MIEITVNYDNLFLLFNFSNECKTGFTLSIRKE